MGSNHHLEEQMYEGEKFLSYFRKTGVEYLPGGIESGFNDVTKPKPFTARLMQVKGERFPRVFNVDMVADSVNEGDVFLLDKNEIIYFWPGKSCGVTEKVKALEVANNIRKSERHCKCEIVYPREDATLDKEFWDNLGGMPASINPPVPDDAASMDDEDQ